MSPDSAHSQDIVTAVIVAHDGAAWLPHVVEAVGNQTRPVQRVVAVDTGSRDRSGALLAQAFGRAAVFGMERATGYGAAVAKALRHRAATTHILPSGGPRDEPTEWVWLLHDDCEPAPDALERLLAGAREAPTAAVLGPKVRDWSDRDLLLEAGLTIDRAGRRVTGIEPREADQGQHDGDRDVLAVSSAGMLARRDVWDELGGFDPGMRLFREDTDFCWRVQAAGYQVRVITEAVVYHVEASARNRRQISAVPHPRRQDRRNALLVLAGNLPARPMLSALVGNLVLSALRTIFFLVAKRPRAALDEFAAYWSVAGHPVRLLTVRRHRSAGRQAAYGRLARDIPPGRSFRMLGEYLITTLSKSQRVEAVGSHHATDDPSDDDSLLTDSGLVQRLLTNPAVLLFLTLTVIALVAERSLLAGTPLSGGALVPAWGGASGLWHEYLQGYHPVSIGTDANTPPYVLVLALLATLLGGKPWLAVDVILLGCVPLAGISAFLATRRVTRFMPARIVGALAYALLPVGIGAVATGRLGTAVLLVLLPPIGVLAGRVFAGPRRKARRAAWAMALLVAVVAAFVPLFWLITAVAMAVGVLALGRRRPGATLNAGIVAAVPLVLLLPWTLDVAADPARIFLEAGVARPGLATPGLAARSLLLLSPGGPGLPPFWVTVGLAAAAAVALVLASRRQAALVLAGWIVAVTGLIFAALASHVSITGAGTAGAVRAWPGPALAVAGAGLLLALVAASDRMAGKLGSGGWRSVAGLAVLGLGVLACSAPALAAAYWVSAGVTGPVRPASGQVLPEFVAVSSDSGLRLRTLVLQTAPGGGVTYMVLRDADPLIGSQELPLPAPAQRALNLSVATLTAPAGGAAEDQGRALASYGIGYVLMPAPISAGLARQLDGVPGLRPVSVTGQFDLWRVVDTTAQVTVVGPGGKVTAVASGPVTVAGARAPAAGGTLVLAAPAGGWSASLNGHPLTPLAAPVNGWAQGFRLPPGGGSLSVSRSEVPRAAVVALTGLAVLVVAGLGLPGARAAGEAEREAAPPVTDDEGLSAGEDEEAEPGRRPGRRAGRSRDKGQDRPGRRRASRRGGAAPEPSPATEVIPPAVPAQAASRLRGAVPAGVRVGWPRRGGGPAGAEPLPDDEPVYADGLAYSDGPVPGRPGTADLTAQTEVFGARASGTAGRHGYQAERDQPAGPDADAPRGSRREPGRRPGHRRRHGGGDQVPPGGAAPPGGPAPPGGAAPPGPWDEDDPRDRVPARAGEPAAYGPAHSRGGYPDEPSGPGSDRRGYSHTRRAFGRRAGPVRDAGAGVPEGPGGYPGAGQGDGRRAAPPPGAAPAGGGGYPDARRGLGRGAGPARQAGGGAPGGRADYPGPRQAPGGQPSQEVPFGGVPDGRDDYALPARDPRRRAADPGPGTPAGPGAAAGPGGPAGPGQAPPPAGRYRGRRHAAGPPQRSMPPSPPGDDALSPLPPLPPRAPRRNRWEDGDPHSDGVPADDERARGRRDEWDEPDW